ncbi:ATP-grasp domain-containing protein [Candidatus Uhrbacteria bacterium]|nr:ATP-grasp domain-containing protein [Candidatus Uhrbacteria bacterium]
MSLQNKTILFVNSGSQKKEYILARAKALGVRIVLLNKELNWAKQYVDDFIEADTYNIPECLEKVKAYHAKMPLDGAVTFWEDDVPLVAAITTALRLKGNTREAADNARSKFRMRELWAKSGVPCQKYALVTTRAEAEIAASKIGFPAIIKPAWGADSEFVVRIDRAEDVRKTFDYVAGGATPEFNTIFLYNKGQFVLEEYIDGPEFNVESLIQNGIPYVISISYKLPKQEPYFMERGDCMPSAYSNEVVELIRDTVARGIQALRIQDCGSNADVRWSTKHNAPRILDLAARMGGDYLYDWVKTVWDIDMIEKILEIAVGERIQLPPLTMPRTYVCGFYLIPNQSGIVTAIDGVDVAHALPGTHEVFLKKHVGDAILVPPDGFENVGWVVGKGESPKAAEEAAREAINCLTVEVRPKQATMAAATLARQKVTFV